MTIRKAADADTDRTAGNGMAGDMASHAVTDPERLLLPAVLFVEDDPSLGAMTTEMLGADHRVDWAQTEGEARDLLSSNRYDALVVDRRLPDGDGLDLVRRLRAAGVTTPALMLTALAEVDDIVDGLDAGANDYLTKPFHFAELEARLRALLRGFHAQASSIMIGDWLLKPGGNLIEDPEGRSTPLTETETKLLATLASSPDHVFPREEILRAAFSDGSDIGAVDVYVSYVRGKTTRRIIDTVRGRGYRIGDPRG
ncbi:response regulator transcription factor [Bifidobacterium sp. CP2]|uniref:response regulator transcription factor n=1 Tax=Bifidobacterium TaxID=1678 RepID=UPI001BDD6994|nr:MULTISPECIES: response regulator transcription factor [Bifidobacterium]MBT1181911.1 response regulator transcription factor [Bifidobacterium sp. CP2]MBW3080080.1 response regulator transcription factor [Bifidobacterium saguinibicoloris]